MNVYEDGIRNIYTENNRICLPSFMISLNGGHASMSEP